MTNEGTRMIDSPRGTGRDQCAQAVSLLTVAMIMTCPTLAAGATQGQSSMVTGMRITKESFHGWPNTYRLTNGLIEARVITDVGPRIMDVRLSGGPNLLHVREAEAGGTGERQWMPRGGWRLWIAPERLETTYVPDNVPCAVEQDGDSMLRVTGAVEQASGIRKQIEVGLTEMQPRLRITSRIRNMSDHSLTYAAWSLPMLRAGGRAFVPLDVGPLTAFDATRRLILWSYAEIDDPRYRFGDRLVEVDQNRIPAAVALSPGRGKDESKIGVDSAQGWAAYLLDDVLFLKRFSHDPAGQYPDGGATIEVYSNHEFLELENLGPLTTIGPGEEIVLREDWWLFANAAIPADAAPALAALGNYVERAPFP
jgi:hypothetical protein